MQILRFRVWDRASERMLQLPDATLVATCMPGVETPAISALITPETPYELAAGAVVMMWTGRRDRNGREIYDGDIIRTVFDIALVYWSRDSSAYMINLKDLDMPELGALTDEMIEVIGNVFENQELLNGREWREYDEGSSDYGLLPDGL
jgi:hypothetical protein